MIAAVVCLVGFTIGFGLGAWWTQRGMTTMYLCEQHRLRLSPYEPYFFIVDVNCTRCLESLEATNPMVN